MDTLAHGLWAYAVFNKKKYAWLGAFFGVLPDLLSFGILFVIGIATGTLHRGKPALESLPSWIFSAYNMTHSLIVFAVVFLIVFLITKKWFWPMLGWWIHILIDIPTHSTSSFFPRLSYSFGKYRFDGISWGLGGSCCLITPKPHRSIFWIALSRTKEKKKAKKKK